MRNTCLDGGAISGILFICLFCFQNIYNHLFLMHKEAMRVKWTSKPELMSWCRTNSWPSTVMLDWLLAQAQWRVAFGLQRAIVRASLMDCAVAPALYPLSLSHIFTTPPPLPFPKRKKICCALKSFHYFLQFFCISSHFPRSLAPLFPWKRPPIHPGCHLPLTTPHTYFTTQSLFPSV